MARQLRADKVGQHRTAYEKNKAKILSTRRVCGICGKPVEMDYKYPHPLSPTIDHIVPISKGGHPSDIENLQLAHRWCNRQKSDKLFSVEKRKNLFDDGTDSAEEENKIICHFDWRNYKAR